MFKWLFFNYRVKKQVKAILRANQTLANLSMDELRAKTAELRAVIQDEVAIYTSQIDQLSKRIAEEFKYNVLKTEELLSKIEKIKEKKRHKEEKILNKLLPEAFAVLRETMIRMTREPAIFLHLPQEELDRVLQFERTGACHQAEEGVLHIATTWNVRGNDYRWNMIPYDVQLEAGVILHYGNLLEMANGEGKTLSAIFPAYLNILSGRKVHIVTANEYLAARDSEWMSPILAFHGFSVAHIENHGGSKVSTYSADVIYGSANEFGFDYLRSNMVLSREEVLTNPFDFVIIDEVDAILIDEARTPLIISGPKAEKEGLEELYEHFNSIVADICAIHRQEMDNIFETAKQKLSDEAPVEAVCEELLKIKFGFFAYPGFDDFVINNSLIFPLAALESRCNQLNTAEAIKEQLLFDINQREVKLTERGKALVAQRLNEPLFWENVNLNQQFKQIESVELWDRLEEKRQKENAIAAFEAQEMKYHIIDKLFKAHLLFHKGNQYVVVGGSVKIIDEHTGRISDGRRYSDGLHQALEAKEGVSIGELTQTYATISFQGFFKKYSKIAGMSASVRVNKLELFNTYGLRIFSVDPHRKMLRKDEDDKVYRTKREKINAVAEEVYRIWQTRRPILLCVPTVEDSKMYSEWLRDNDIPHHVLNAVDHELEAEIISRAGQPGQLVVSAKLAGRGTDIKVSPEAVALGGLAVISSERNLSRRHDDQLKGRAGRQGLPGSSVFFVSLEDELMRMFQSERIAKLMDKMGHTEGELITNSMVSKSIQRAQRKVEENNAYSRNRLYEYDINLHLSREIIYGRRNNALYGSRLQLDVMNMFYNCCQEMVAQYKYDYYQFCLHFQETFNIQVPFDEKTFLQDDTIVDRMFDFLYQDQYLIKSRSIVQALMPQIIDVNEREGDRYIRILIPILAKGEPFNVSPNIKAAIQSGGLTIIEDIERHFVIKVLDEEWKLFLKSQDEWKNEVDVRSQIEKKDALVMFKSVFLDEYQSLIARINEVTVSYLAHFDFYNQTKSDDSGEVTDTELQSDEDISDEEVLSEVDEFLKETTSSRSAISSIADIIEEDLPRKVIGRNDPCPCGSGKKYKNCHGGD